jgi:hypothetical protein
MESTRTWHLTSANGNHMVQVCPNDTVQSEVVARYIYEGLMSNEAVIVCARSSLRKIILSKLEEQGLDIIDYKNQGQIKFFEADYLLSTFYTEGLIEESDFYASVGLPLEETNLKFGKVRIFGEMVNLLWKQGEYDAAMQLEDCWNNLSQNQEFSLLCSYSLDNLDPVTYEESIEMMYKCHKHLTPVANPELESETILDVFGIAWNRAVTKFTTSQDISMPMIN